MNTHAASTSIAPTSPARLSALSDEEVVRRVRAGDTGLYNILAQRYGKHLRGTLSRILHSELETEDVIQEGHLHALAHLDQFEGRSSFATWLTRIMMHDAFARARRQERFRPLDPMLVSGAAGVQFHSGARSPEQLTLDTELRGILRHALETLPEHYRRVFVMREIEELSTEAAARRLGISEVCLKTRLFRARCILRKRCRRIHPGGGCDSVRQSPSG